VLILTVVVFGSLLRELVVVVLYVSPGSFGCKGCVFVSSGVGVFGA